MFRADRQPGQLQPPQPEEERRESEQPESEHPELGGQNAAAGRTAAAGQPAPVDPAARSARSARAGAKRRQPTGSRGGCNHRSQKSGGNQSSRNLEQPDEQQQPGNPRRWTPQPGARSARAGAKRRQPTGSRGGCNQRSQKKSSRSQQQKRSSRS